ncbi:MAG: 50S ribosomal protein L18e [Thaumarchaeota archaeon]|nr:MAG: 50S ribosomal protein L18e [Candidatus Wolframiiraptor sp.]RLG06885.1 MAG: 50S ribosomal protein L18e [Nitrososphaerota archaeon]
MVSRRKVVKPGFKLMLLKSIPKEAKKTRFWKRILEEADRPRRNRRTVNLYKLNRLTESGDAVYVPGKVLGTGDIDHPITISAFSFSKKAYEKLLKSGSTVLTTKEFAEKYPRGSGVKIIG